MRVDIAQIEAIQAELKRALAEQTRILAETDQIINVVLPNAWECEAQRAYQQAYITIRANVLTQVNDLISLFDRAHALAAQHLSSVDLDLSSMTASL